MERILPPGLKIDVPHILIQNKHIRKNVLYDNALCLNIFIEIPTGE